MVAGWLLLTGAAVFLAGAFAPTSRVFTMGDVDASQQFLEARATTWRLAQVGFAGGALITPFGVLALALDLSGRSCLLAVLAAVGMLVGAVPWSVHCRLRAERIGDFTHGGLPGWHYLVYVWLTLASFVLMAGALEPVHPDWLAWFVAGCAAAFALALVVFRDLPPFLLYVVTIVVGVAAL